MRSWRLAIIITVLLLPGLLQAGQVAFDYNTAPRTVRACVLLVNNGLTNGHPYVLPVLSRSSLKPAGWTFVNPLAPTQITDAIWGLWLDPVHNSNANDPANWRSGANYWTGRGIVAGSPLRLSVPPECPQYWEVPLTNETAEQLTQFDLIYIASLADLNVTTTLQRAGLVRAVENGAVLWIDNVGGNVLNFPLPRSGVAAPFAFAPIAGGNLNLTGAPVPFPRMAAQAGHALLNFPYRIGPAEIGELGDFPDGPGNYPGVAVTDPVGANDVQLTPVVYTFTPGGIGAGIRAARYGQGAIVVTAEGIGQDIEEWWAALPEPSELQRADLKLAYNIVNYSHSAGGAGGGPAQGNVELTPAKPPLALTWQFPPPWGDPTLPSQPGPLVGSPAVSEGYIYVLSTAGAGNRPPRLWCLEHKAGFPNGYQVVWSGVLPNGCTPRASSPQIAMVPDNNGVSTPVVLVTGTNQAGGPGVLACYAANNSGNAVAPLWSANLGTYNGNGDVVDISSPVCYKDWLFLVQTEFDTGAGAGIQGVYGRVRAIKWGWGGIGVSWVYPDSAREVHQKLLPPSQDVAWASDATRGEIPPRGDVRPAVTTSPRLPFGTQVEAALVVPAAARLNWAFPAVTTTPSAGAYCVVPIPLDAAGAALLNPRYFVAALNNTGDVVTVNTAERDDGPLATPPGEPIPVNTNPVLYSGVAYAQFDNAGAALAFFDTLSDPGQADGYDDPLILSQGCRVGISYDVVLGGVTSNYTNETHFLPGPVPWRSDVALAQHLSEKAGQTIACGSGVSVLDTENGTLKARWLASSDSPLGLATINPSSPAQDGATAYAASNAITGLTPLDLSQATTLVHGINPSADLTVHLGPQGVADNLGILNPSVVTVTALATGTPIPAGDFEVDYSTRVVRFLPSAGPAVAGKALTFGWTDSGGGVHNDLHVVSRLDRFDYVPRYVRLRFYPVVNATVTVTLTDGTPVTGVVPGEPTPLPNFQLPGRPGVEPVLANGWLDFTNAQVTDVQGVNHTVIGREVLIRYEGFSEPDSAVATIVDERQQVPVELGYNRAGVTGSGQTLTVGTLGKADAAGTAFVTPAGTESAYNTLLSLVWDPISHLVRGEAARPAYDDPAGPPLVPGVFSAPTSAGGNLYVSSAALTAPLAVGESGWLGCLGPRRTIICDANRLVETTGTERTWTLTGSSSYVYGRTAPEPMLSQPFSRPAKAAHLNDDTFLVVDTGNNRVLVVDRSGSQIWPLDEYGNDYYSSAKRPDAAVPGGVAGNFNLQLAQPADAYRYSDSTGAIHTVIADTGHNRLVEIITTYLPAGGQQHQVVELTPSYVRLAWDPTHRLKLRYTRAQPIFDFGNGNVIGYLCAAANIDRVVVVETKRADGSIAVDPAPTSTPPGGTRPWSDWFNLYDAAAGPRFPNLRDVEYFRFGDRVYVLVVAGGMDNSNNDGVWMWEIDATTGGGGMIGGGGPHNSTWQYTAATYAASTGAFGVVVTPSAPSSTYQKRFYPVCAKLLFPGRLYDGNVLITNYTGVMENLARENVGSLGSGLNGEVFEVNRGGALLQRRMIPDPFTEDWNDPLNQPSYAERY